MYGEIYVTDFMNVCERLRDDGKVIVSLISIPMHSYLLLSICCSVLVCNELLMMNAKIQLACVAPHLSAIRSARR